MADWKDTDDLKQELQDDFDGIEKLGKDQHDHQEDLENFQAKLQFLQSMPGLFEDSDSQLESKLESAIEVRNESIADCKQEMGEMQKDLEVKANNLDNLINKSEQKINKMGDLINTLNKSDVKLDLLRQKSEYEKDTNDGKEKKNGVLEMVKNIGIAVGVANAAQVADFINNIYEIGQKFGILK